MRVTELLISEAHKVDSAWKKERLVGCKCWGPKPSDVNPKCRIHGTEAINEGFSDFSVGGSDSAWDLHFTVEEAMGKVREQLENKLGSLLPSSVIDVKVCEAAIKALRKGLKDKGNAFNTHGTLNVAMILDEKFSSFRKYDAWKSFALEIAAKLRQELSSKKFSGEYLSEMTSRAHAIETWAKKASRKK